MIAADLFFALRPLLWIPAVALYAAGAAWKGPVQFGLMGRCELWALLLFLGVVHLANGWRDRVGDRLNRKGFPVATGVIKGAALLVLGTAAFAAALVLSLGCSGRAQALLLGAAGVGAAYTIPPLELKRRAGFDLCAHAAGYGVLAFLLGAESAGALDPPGSVRELLLASVPYALGIGTVALCTMIADIDGDAASGQRTLAVALGSSRANALAVALAWSTLATAVALLAWVPLLWGLLAALTLTLSGGSGAEKPGPNPGRAPIWLQVLFLALLTPRTVEPLVFASVLGLASAVYYGRRWGIRYPVALRRPGY